MTMRRSCSLFRVGLSGLALLASGCGYDPFAPPSRPKPPPTVAETESPSKPDFLVFVVPGELSPDVQNWSLRAQHEANDKRAIFRMMGPGPTDPPAQQAEVVRKAMAEGATALIVYPGEAPELPKALAEAESKGVPVVLIDKPLAAPEGAKPFTVVEPEPFGSTAKQIVAATIDDLKRASRPVDGTAIVLADKVADQTSARRVEALKAAAVAAKFRQVVTVPFDGTGEAASKQAVLEAIKANPDVSVVLCDDAEGLMASAIVRVEAKGKPTFFVGGYTGYRTSRVTQEPVRESCYVEGRYAELAGLAVITALARLRGESVGEHAYVTSKFTKAQGDVTSESVPKSSLPTAKSAEGLDTIIKEIAPPKKDAKPQ
jgi:ABC-type sugar transport system substrate-binding protein